MYTSPDRFYRRLPEYPEEQSIQVVMEESDLWIRAPRLLPAEDLRVIALEELRAVRGLLTLWITKFPVFRDSLVPLEIPAQTPPLLEQMYKAGRFASVGPFAAVAGTVAEAVARAIHKELKARGLPQNVLVENGGDMFLFSEKERVIALLAEPEKQIHPPDMPNTPNMPDLPDASLATQGKKTTLFPPLALTLPPEAFPCALAASSATIGHSLSFGKADLVVARSQSGALADACATSLANALQSAEDLAPFFGHLEKRGILPGFLPKAFPTAHLDGVFAFVDGAMGFWNNAHVKGAAEIVRL